MNDDQWALTNFKGIARLFPLPNLVLFPHVVQPLHIFEPRYRAMTADALAGDRLIAMALLQPGWEDEYEGCPALHPVVCLGRIVAEQQRPDGRYNLLLRGLSRARITQELTEGKQYRSARLHLLSDTDVPGQDEAGELRKQLRRQVLPWFPNDGPAREQLDKLVESDLPLGVLCDILSFALSLPIEAKQDLLEVLDVGQRVSLLLGHLEKGKPQEKASDKDREFPPGFSVN